MESILFIVGVILAAIFGFLYLKGRKNENNSGHSSGNIDSTVTDIANDTGKNRINSFLDKARRLLQGIRSSTDSKGDSKDGSGGDSTDSNRDGK
jgi:hypothetical protein